MSERRQRAAHCVAACDQVIAFMEDEDEGLRAMAHTMARDIIYKWLGDDNPQITIRLIMAIRSMAEAELREETEDEL